MKAFVPLFQRLRFGLAEIVHYDKHEMENLR